MGHTTDQRCNLCDRSFADRKTFGRHLWEEHHLTPDQYRVQVLGIGPKCCNPNCNNPVPRNTEGGWHKACSAFCAIEMRVDIPLGASGMPLGLPSRRPSAAPSATVAGAGPYLGQDAKHLSQLLVGVLLVGLVAGGLAAIAQWAMEAYLGWTPGPATFFLSIRATTIAASFLGAVVGAFAVMMFNDMSGSGDGLHMGCGMIGCVLGALAGRLATHFDWAPEVVAQLVGFEWAHLAEKWFGAGTITPFWMRLLGGALSGVTILLVGYLVGSTGCWGDAARFWPTRLVRLVIAWGLVGFAIWRILVALGS